MELNRPLRLVIIKLALLMVVTDAARILGIFPLKAKSHFGFNEAIMRSLSNAGHEVIIFAPYPLTKSTSNITLIDSDKTKLNPIKAALRRSAFQFMLDAFPILKTDCEDVVKMKEFQDILRSTEKKYDIMFLEMLSFYECYLPLAEKLDIPVIGTTSLRSWIHADHAVGNPGSPSYVPTTLSDTGSIDSFHSRLVSFINKLFIEILRLFYEIPNIRAIHNRFYSSYNLNYTKKVSLVFTNNHPIILSRPTVPNTVEVGGLKVKSSQLEPLPETLQTFIDEATHGVVLFSMGSMGMNDDYLSSNTRVILEKIFTRIPQRVIWKSEIPMNDITDKVHNARWLPQNEILHHENVKVFITHCGLNSIYEAIHSATPMILIPIHTDQGYHAHIMESYGVGIRVDIATVTEEILQNAITTITNDKRYKDNIEKLSRIFNDQSMPPNESIVYWTEYVLKYKEAPHLRIKAADMSLYKYLLLDVFAFLIFVAFFVVFVTFLLAKMVYSTLLCIILKDKDISGLSVKMEKKIK